MILSQSNFYIVIPLFAIVLGDGVHTAAEVFWKVDGRKISLERHSPSACTSREFSAFRTKGPVRNSAVRNMDSKSKGLS